MPTLGQKANAQRRKPRVRIQKPRNTRIPRPTGLVISAREIDFPDYRDSLATQATRVTYAVVNAKPPSSARFRGQEYLAVMAHIVDLTNDPQGQHLINLPRDFLPAGRGLRPCAFGMRLRMPQPSVHYQFEFLDFGWLTGYSTTKDVDVPETHLMKRRIQWPLRLNDGKDVCRVTRR